MIDASSPPVRGPRLAGWSGLLILAGLVVLGVAALAPALDNGFVDLDDEESFLLNHAFRGLGWSQLRWAGTSFLLGAYQPLARTFHCVEYAFFGLDARRYHATSLAWHLLNAATLYGLVGSLLSRSRSDAGRSTAWLAAGVATAVYLVHPLAVEPVSWATAQAFLPATWFALVSVGAWWRAQSRSNRTGRLGWLAASALAFAASLACYPIASCLPLVLLAFSVARRSGAGGLPSARGIGLALLETAPHFVLSTVFGAIAVHARSQGEGLVSLAQDGVITRLALACESAFVSLGKTLWPGSLRAVYPVPPELHWSQAPLLLSLIGVTVVSVLAILGRRRAPILAAGWFAYLVIRLPNAGLLRHGSTVVADRYSYLPNLVLAVVLAAILQRVLERQRRPARLLLRVGTLAVVAVLAGEILASRAQCRTWHDSIALWTHVLDQDDPADPWFESRLGRALADTGRHEEAEAHLRAAVERAPGLAYAHLKLGLTLIAMGRGEEAEPHFVEAVRLEPGDPEGRINLGFVLTQKGQITAAIEQMREAVRLRPELVPARLNLGALLGQAGRLDESEAEFAEAVRLDPARPEARMGLGFALARRGAFAEAAEQYAAAAKLAPDDPGARCNLGTILDQLGRRDEAREQFAVALQLDPNLVEARAGLERVRR